MPESTNIIVRWLWRFYPSVWLAWTVRYLLDWCVRALEEHREWLDRCEGNAAWYGGWLALAETRLDELIAMKAMKRLGRPWAARRKLRHFPARGVRSAAQGLKRLTFLIARYNDAERLIDRRVRTLQRLIEACELQLEITHHPVEAQPASAGGAGVGGAGVFEIADSGVQLQPDARIRAPP